EEGLHLLEEERAGEGRPLLRAARAPGTVGRHGHEHVCAVTRREYPAGAAVLAGGSGARMRRPYDGSRDVFPARHHPVVAQPEGAVGFSSGTSSPGLERETELSELDSHAKSARNLRPWSFSGARTEICPSRSMFAPSTPAAETG